MSPWRRSSRTLGALLLAGLTLLQSSAASAQTDRERALQLAEQARTHFVAGEYVDALALFEQAFELDPHPAILYNQARCLEELGELPRALVQFRAALAMNPGESIRGELEAKIAEIESVLQEQGYALDQVDPDTYVALAGLTVTSLPEGAEVFVGGERVGVTPLDDLFLPPGTYELAVSLEGHQTHVRTVTIEPSRNLSVHAGLRRLEAVTEYQPPEPGFLELTGPRRDMEVLLDEEVIGRTPLSGTAIAPGQYLLTVRHPEFADWHSTLVVRSGETTQVYAESRRLDGGEPEGMGPDDWGLVAGISGGVVLVTGVVFGVLAQADADRYGRNTDTPSRVDIRETAIREALIADVALASGIALLATSAVLIFAVDSDGEDGEETEDLVRIETGPVPAGWAVGLGGVW